MWYIPAVEYHSMIKNEWTFTTIKLDFTSTILSKSQTQDSIHCIGQAKLIYCDKIESASLQGKRQLTGKKHKETF